MDFGFACCLICLPTGGGCFFVVVADFVVFGYRCCVVA